MTYLFSKYHGAGNDFFISDQSYLLDLNEEDQIQTIRAICHRRLGVGADGLIIVVKGKADGLQTYFFNSDGKRGSFCGNGSRCALDFALEKKMISPGTFDFNYWEDKYSACVSENGIQLKMKNVSIRIETDLGFFTDTGSPHLIREVNFDEIPDEELLKVALHLRHHPQFKIAGTNVNFLHPEITPQGAFRIKTFERGVENFTYACGTGAVAIAAYLAWKNQSHGTFNVLSKGGLLKVVIGQYSESVLSDIWLSGPVAKVYEGQIEKSAISNMVEHFKNAETF